MVNKSDIEQSVREDFETLVIDNLLIEEAPLRDTFKMAMTKLLKACENKTGNDLDACINQTKPEIEELIREAYKRRGYI